MDVDLRVDPLSITMVMVVTGVGSLIHLYAIGYMEHEPRLGRFFAYMNLFCASCWCSSWRTTSCCSTSAGRAWGSARTC